MNTNRFSLRRLSGAPALGDAVTAEQAQEAEAFVRAYQGDRKYVLSLQAWLAGGRSLSRRQVAAALQFKAQETPP